jgi:hemoglobin-like flavoprotein
MGNLSRLLKESWTLVEEQQDKVAGYFYARIFLSNPHLRTLFPVHMDVQRARLLGAIVTAIQTLDDPERFEDYLRALGRDHRKFHVQPEHYDVVRDALLEAIRTFAGEQWGVEYEQAWADAYNVIAKKMTAGADADTNPPFWHAEVLSHERRSRDIAVFTLRPLQHPLDYRAGQYVSVEAPRYQPRLWRTYSMANAPRPDGTLDFHVRRGVGLQRAGPPGETRRPAADRGAYGLDDAGPQVDPRHRLRGRRHRTGADPGPP